MYGANMIGNFSCSAKSGDPSNHWNECNWGHQARCIICFNSFSEYFFAIAEVIEESRPPESKTPYGTSDINCLLTVFSKDSLSLVISDSTFLTLSQSSQSLLYHF